MENQQPFSIEQAGNYLKATKNDKSNEIKEQARKSAITVTPEEDRVKYLRYAVSTLNRVDMEIVKLFARIVNRTPEMFNGKEIADILKKILVLRVYGYSAMKIGNILRERAETVDKLEDLAIKAVKNEIQRRRSNDIPVIGG